MFDQRLPDVYSSLKTIFQFAPFNICNLVPRAFPLKVGGASLPSLKEKPWERGCWIGREATGISGYIWIQSYRFCISHVDDNEYYGMSIVFFTLGGGGGEFR